MKILFADVHGVLVRDQGAERRKTESISERANGLTNNAERNPLEERGCVPS